MSPLLRHKISWTLLALLCGIASSTRADTLAEDNVKAGLILNFAKYAEWPSAVMAGDNLRICALGNQPLSGKLAQMQGRQVQGREIQVRTSARLDELRDCHVLYVPAGEQQRLDTMLRILSQAPVLTVSDIDGFAQAGGIIGLKLRAGRVRFDINLAVARGAGLTLSSQLLKLADEVVQ